MKRTLMMTAGMIFAANMAFAAITTDTVAADLTAQGYTSIEITKGLTQIKVEAANGTQTLEVVYDIATGAVLHHETGTVEAGNIPDPGVSVRARKRDFVKGQDGAEDGVDAKDDGDKGHDTADAAGDDDGDKGGGTDGGGDGGGDSDGGSDGDGN